MLEQRGGGGRFVDVAGADRTGSLVKTYTLAKRIVQAEKRGRRDGTTNPVIGYP